MAKNDYYEALGVNRDATAEDLKKAYRKQAMQYHPDRNQGDKKAEHKFKEISEAYEVLKDEQKRAAYDRFGHSAFEGGGMGGAGHPGGGGFDFNFSGSFADVFDEIFGGSGGRRGGDTAQRGNDLRYNLEITLEEAFKGAQTKIKVASQASCEGCKGSGAAAGTSPKSCATCQGRGKVRAQQGFFTIERSCFACQGMGQTIEKPCRGCGGSGRTRREKTLAVNIPAGVEDGSRIRLSGEGEAGVRGGQPGDLYVFLSIKPHRFFEREGAAIYCRVPIPMTTAALGGSIEVPTIDSTKAKITIPEGTQSGRQFRLKGKGMSALRSTARGDMYVQVIVETPVNLTKKQKELLGKFEEDGGKHETSPESAGFFSKVKEFWDELSGS